ncbi:hypothetical protein B9Z55_028335 [Caenorhabditis nigoni]|uniref:Uncharacterized protein n=1 Tax=Caenorhabditis nigoni TaxID=1611254 RepID=A0A2G5SCD8_9PELO|nr:hypothetical protein B9Z55_028335 [Caenorhabditis nigoni]
MGRQVAHFLELYLEVTIGLRLSYPTTQKRAQLTQNELAVVLDEIPQDIKDDKENRDYLTTAVHNHNPNAASTMKESEYRFTIQFICSQASRSDIFGHTKLIRYSSGHFSSKVFENSKKQSWSSMRSPLRLFCFFRN